MAPWGAAVPLVPELRFGAAGLGRRRISRPPDASVSWGGGVWERLRCGCRWHRECCGWCAAMRAAAWLRVARAVPCWSAALGLRVRGRFGAGRRHRDCGRQGVSSTLDGKICAPCMIRGTRAAKSAPSWQDPRAVYPPTAVCGAFRMHGAHILPKPAHFGCVARDSCRELAIFPSEAPSEMHEAQNLPRIAARERTAEESCHGKTPENAPRENIAPASQAKGASGRNPATVGRWGTHFASVLPSSNARERIKA